MDERTCRDELTLQVRPHQCHFPVAQRDHKVQTCLNKALPGSFGRGGPSRWSLGPSPSHRRLSGCGSLLLSQQPPHKPAELVPGDFWVRGDVLSFGLSFPSWTETVFKWQLQQALTSRGSARLWAPLLRLRAHSAELSPGWRTGPARPPPDSTAHSCCRPACSSIRWWHTGRGRFGPRSGKGGKRVIYPAKKSVFSGHRHGPR